MRKSRISFNISKKRGKSEGGESNMAATEPSLTATQHSTLKLSSYHACRFCCKRFKSEQSYESHSKTRKHGRAVKAGTEFELKKSRTCAGCKQTFDTRLLLTQHCKKNSHTPLVQKTSLKSPEYGKPYTEAEQEDPFVSIKYYSPYYCEICDLDCVNVTHYEDHAKGERHEKAVEKRAEQGKGVLVDLDTNEVDTTDKCLVIVNKVEPVIETVSAYYCGICDTDCRSEIAYTEHVTSKSHQIRMDGHGQLKISCDLCCMTFNSENNHKMHLKSKKHANNLAARQRLLPVETDTEKESVHDLRDKIKRTISPPLENFDKIKVNIAGDLADDANTRSVVVDIEADEDDAMEMGMPRVTLDKKEKKELERKLKEDEEERGKWAKRREEEYGKKRAEILKASKWDSKVETKVETKGRGRGRGQVVFSDKYKWVAPGLKNQGEKSDSNTPRERYSKDDKERYSKDESGGRYSKEESKERYSKEGSKDHGSRERYSRDDSKSDKRDKRDTKSDRRRKTYDDDKYTSDSDDERVILKKGERKTMDNNDDDLRKVINKQRGIVEKDDGKSLVFDYGHQRMENASGERAGLKGFFGGAFAHLREDSGPSQDTKKEVDSYGGAKMEGSYGGAKMEETKEPEKDLGKDMERTLLLELLKRQFPDIRYLTERQGGLELMQKIFGAHGMAAFAGLDLEGAGSVASARSIASDEGSVKSQQFKQDGNVLSLVSEGVQPAEETKVEAKSASQEKRESRIDQRSKSRSRSKSRERRRRSRSRSDSKGRSDRKKSRYSSRKRSRSSSRDRYSKRSRRTPSPDKRKKDERVDKSSDEKDQSKTSQKDQSKTSQKDKKESLVSQTKAKSKDAKDKALAKWTVSNWSGGNEEGGNDGDEKGERKKADEKGSKRGDRKEDKRYKEKEGTKEEDSRKAKRKEEPKTDREQDKKRQRINSEGDKIFDDASDYEDIDVGTKDLKDQFENDYEDGGEKRRSKVEGKGRSDGDGKRDSRKARGQGSSKSGEDSESKIDQKRRETEGRGDEKRRDSEDRDEKRRKRSSYDRYNYDDRGYDDVGEEEMDDLQKDLLANLARVENLGRVLPPVVLPFPIGGGPFMPPLSGPPLSGPPLNVPLMSMPPLNVPPRSMPPLNVPPISVRPLSVPPPGLGLLPPLGGPYPPRPGLAPVMGPVSSVDPTIPVNPNSALTYIQPTEGHHHPPRMSASSSTERALKSLLSQVSALGAGGKTISTSSLLRPVSSARSGSESQKLSSELDRLGEVYSDDFEASDDESGSKPLKSILKKKSKFLVGQANDQSSSWLPKNAVGAEYVVSTGEQAKYFCQLCDVQFATLSAKNLHLRGPKHLAMFMKHKSPLIDEMIQQAMGVVVGKSEEKDRASEDSDEEKEVESEIVKKVEPRDSTPSPLPKRPSPSPEPVKESSEKERSISPYDNREPRLYVDERTGRIVQAGGYYSEEKAGRSAGSSRGSREDPQGSREDTQVPREDQSTSSKSSESGPSKLELGAVPTPDEYDRLSQRAKDVLSREEYAQLPASTRKLLLLETSDQPGAKGPEQSRAKESDEFGGSIPRDHDRPLAAREHQKPDDVRSTEKDFEQAPPAGIIKDYDDLSARARSLLTRDEYERLQARDKEYLSREEYLTREGYDKQTTREATPLSRDEYEAAARERERLVARDLVSRESYDRLDRERLADLDRLADRERLALADRDRLALTERERLALADRDRLALADRDRLALSERERLALADRDRLTLAERDRLALADRDRLPSLADRDRLTERDRLAQRDYDRYPPRDDLPYRPGLEDYARERGRPVTREEYSRYIGPLDDDLAQRRDDYARQRMREEISRPLPREGYRDPDYRRDPRDAPPGGDPWDERSPPGRDYRDWDRSRDTYGDPRSRDIRVVSDRGAPSGYSERRMSPPPRTWARGAEGGQERAQEEGQDPRKAPTSGAEPARAPDGERRPDETPQKEEENAGRLGSYEARPPADRREVTDTHAYGQQSYRDDESDPRYRPRGEPGPDKYDSYGYDSSRRGGPGASRGHRGRGGGNRGGQRGHPRNAGFNRGQPRRGGQGRY